MPTTKKPDQIAHLARTLHVAGDPNRLRILCHLFRVRTACVSDVAGALDLGVALVSHHLKALADADVLTAAREGKRTCYALAPTREVGDLKRFICNHT